MTETDKKNYGEAMLYNFYVHLISTQFYNNFNLAIVGLFIFPIDKKHVKYMKLKTLEYIGSYTRVLKRRVLTINSFLKKSYVITFYCLLKHSEASIITVCISIREV